MRVILFVTPGFPLPSQTFIVNKFLGLLAMGWDIYLVAPQSHPGNWQFYPELRQPEVRKRIIILPLNQGDKTAVWHSFRSWLSAPLISRRYWRRARKLQSKQNLEKKELQLFSRLLALQPDLLHFEFKWPATRWIYLKQLLNCKVIVGLRSSEFDYTKPANFYDILWHNADALHLLGRDLWQRAHRLGCPPSLADKTIPPAIDTDFWNLRKGRHTEVVGLPERPLRLLTVSRLEWTKGIEHAFQVVQQLVEQGIHCVYNIIGSGKYAAALHYARHQMGLVDVVQFWGAQSRFQVRDAMAHADVLLHTAVSEGFCNAALEAQAMQLPVVCSDADGLPENVVHGQTGFVLPRRNTQAMVKKIKILTVDSALRQQMGNAGRVRVQQHFQAADQISAWDAFYREVMAAD
ncbi:MAG: glycosyltransferase family 4 protein [Chloroflexi bacterium]|nr:glycosyltransferase family 4 protein [Chloroflexota bacterium]